MNGGSGTGKTLLAVPRAAKVVVESALGSAAWSPRLAAALDSSALVLAFHNVIPDSETPRGDQSLHCSLSRFREIIDWLPEVFDVVEAGSAFTQDSRPRAAITFDDAYAGALALAVPELVQRGLPATIFVISGMDEGQTFWWDALADPREGLSAGLRERALTEGSGQEETVRALARANGWSLQDLSGPFVAAQWKEIVNAAGLPGIDVAHHSRTHANAAVLDRETLVSELASGKAELETRLPGVKPWLAWPYGRSSARARAIAMESGYEVAFRVDGGVWRNSDPPPPRFRLPRLNVPAGLTLKGFRVRAIGLLGR